MKIINFLFTGSVKDPETSSVYNPSHHYDQEELKELEIDSKKIFKTQTALNSLSTDMDSSIGSLNVASISTWDSVFSSLGSALSQKLSDRVKLAFSGVSFLASVLASKIKIPILSDEINFFSFGGRLLRSPLHIFDSFFSVLGENWSKSKLAPRLAFGASALALGKSLIKNDKDAGIEFHYQSINGTIGRSVIHHVQSMLASSAKNLFERSPWFSSLAAAGAIVGSQLLPIKLKEKEISWKTLDGILGQSIFHMEDSILASMGSKAANGIYKFFHGSKIGTVFSAGLTLIGINFFRERNRDSKFMKRKFPFPQFYGKQIRSLIHLPESFIFKLGSELGKSKLGLGLTALIMLNAYGDENHKIPLNTFEGLTARLPHDMVQASLSQAANTLSEKLPAPLVTVLGPMASHHLAKIFRAKSTKFNENHGLIRKNLIYFWENLLSSAAYKTGRKLAPTLSKEKEYTGSLLADGRWITKDGRITPSMILGKQN